MSQKIRGIPENLESELPSVNPEIATVQHGTNEKVMNVCRGILQTTNTVTRNGAELAGIATGSVINATVGFAGGLLKGVTGKTSNAA